MTVQPCGFYYAVIRAGWGMGDGGRYQLNTNSPQATEPQRHSSLFLSLFLCLHIARSLSFSHVSLSVALSFQFGSVRCDLFTSQRYTCGCKNKKKTRLPENESLENEVSVTFSLCCSLYSAQFSRTHRVSVSQRDMYTDKA